MKWAKVISYSFAQWRVESKDLADFFNPMTFLERLRNLQTHLSTLSNLNFFEPLLFENFRWTERRSFTPKAQSSPLGANSFSNKMSSEDHILQNTLQANSIFLFCFCGGHLCSKPRLGWKLPPVSLNGAVNGLATTVHWAIQVEMQISNFGLFRSFTLSWNTSRGQSNKALLQRL
jgi:hypothetical protein